MMSLKKCIAINAVLLLLGLVGTSTWAGEVAGTVMHLSGPLLEKKQNGVVKILSEKSTVEQGDTLVSEKNTYALIKFIDNSEITLRPNSQFKIDSFSFDQKKPENDNAIFKLIKGGLRSITGLLGKRNHDRFSLNTPTATIGIRGTIFIAEYIPATLPSAPTPSTDGRLPGLYVEVLDGMIHVHNDVGIQNFSKGQFGYTPSATQPPVILPSNPGMQFTPPASFTPVNSSQTGNNHKQSEHFNCEVR